MSFDTIVPSLLGGALIGLSASMVLAVHGRIAGITGILAGALAPGTSDRSWRLGFLVGLVVVGLVAAALAPASFTASPRSLPTLVVAGLLVGFGTRMGSGCTSGHGVCGVARFSRRSIVASATFIGVGAITVGVINRLLGGSL